MTWEWAIAWWSTYGKPGELRILVASDEAGAIVGIAPLYRQSPRKYGQTVSALSFVGDHSADSDYLDFIIASGREAEVMEAFRRHLDQNLSRGVVLDLNEIPETSPNLGLLREMAGTGKMISREEDVPCGTVHLPSTWQDYLAMLRPRFRTKVRSVLRSLEERPDVHFGFCQDAEHTGRLLPVLFDLHTRRWTGQGKPGVFGWDLKRRFYQKLSARLLERGWLRFSWLEWNGRILACQYGFVHEGTYFQLQEGYEPASEHWNVGIGLRAWSIREFLKQGIREYDFMAGMGRHKSDWGAASKLSKRFLLACRSPKTILFCRGEKWEESAKGAARRVIPEKILALRKGRSRSRPEARPARARLPRLSPNAGIGCAGAWRMAISTPACRHSFARCAGSAINSRSPAMAEDAGSPFTGEWDLPRAYSISTGSTTTTTHSSQQFRRRCSINRSNMSRATTGW